MKICFKTDDTHLVSYLFVVEDLHFRFSSLVGSYTRLVANKCYSNIEVGKVGERVASFPC